MLQEKNQEIDHLSEQVTRLTTELEELKSDKGVEHMVSSCSFVGFSTFRLEQAV